MEPSSDEMKDEAAAQPARRTSDIGIEIEGLDLEADAPASAPRSPRSPASSNGDSKTGCLKKKRSKSLKLVASLAKSASAFLTGAKKPARDADAPEKASPPAEPATPKTPFLPARHAEKKIKEYVRLCASDQPSVSKKEAAARELWTLALHDRKADLVQAGAVDALILLLDSQRTSAKCAEYGARALWNLAIDDANKKVINEAGAVGPLVRLVDAGSVHCKEAAAGALRNLAVDVENQRTIVAEGGVPPLLALCGSSDKDGAEVAARALWNLAYNSRPNQTALVEAGAIPVLVKMAKDGASDACKEAAAGALRNLSFENDAARMEMVNNGAIPALAAVCLDGAERTRVHAGALLKNLNSEPSCLRAVAAESPPASHILSGEGQQKRVASAVRIKESSGRFGSKLDRFQLPQNSAKAEVDAAVDSLLATRPSRPPLSLSGET